MTHRKIAKKSIKLAYLRTFFAHKFFFGAYFCAEEYLFWTFWAPGRSEFYVFKDKIP